MAKFSPLDLHIVRMHWDGMTASDIDNKLNKASGWAARILAKPESQKILDQLKESTIDTMIEVQTKLQVEAPLLLAAEIDFALSGNEAAHSKARQKLLELAGHVATRQVEIRRPDHIEEEFRNKSTEQIKAEILRAINDEEAPPKDESTKPPVLH